jgi:Na+-transporting NADH:ubiquinone oxidoreductase subunit A
LAKKESVESFKRYQPEELTGLSREEVLAHLLDTGLVALIRQRPFDRIADPETRPKSIFINGMNTAPCAADPNVLVEGRGTDLQAGIDVLGRLTEGPVHLCLTETASPVFTAAQRVTAHTFSGPHPSGNTSVHIHHIDPIAPHDTVWTIRAEDVLQLGSLFLNGEIPSTRVVALAGPGIREGERRYYRVRQGGSLQKLLQGRTRDAALRAIGGDVFSGRQVDLNGHLHYYDSAITLIEEGGERLFLGWLLPGAGRFSLSRAYLSRWLKPKDSWALNASRNGSLRAMVLTGIYDRYLPMKIMVDYLVRAVLAHDTDEAVNLGILETVPEDFALSAFACPSKMDLCGIIQDGLKEIEEEGL